MKGDNMRTKIILTILAVTLVAALAYAGDQWRRGMGFGPDDEMGANGFLGPGMILRHADDIGLTEDQVSQISKLTQSNALARIDKQAELDKAETTLRHLRMNNAADNEILSAMDEVGLLRTELWKMNFNHRQAVRKILTEAQLDKIKEMGMKQRGDGWNRRGRGMNRGDRPGPGFGQGEGLGPGPSLEGCMRR
jgi:Spy/CpxP family protein refolding chaperone